MSIALNNDKLSRKRAETEKYNIPGVPERDKKGG
jgi:hypothetical protein